TGSFCARSVTRGGACSADGAGANPIAWVKDSPGHGIGDRPRNCEARKFTVGLLDDTSDERLVYGTLLLRSRYRQNRAYGVNGYRSSQKHPSANLAGELVRCSLCSVVSRRRPLRLCYSR